MEIWDVADGLVNPSQAGSHSVGEDSALLGEADTPVVPIEEGTPEPALELPDGMTHRRLSHFKFFRCAGKAVVSRHDGKSG